MGHSGENIKSLSSPNSKSLRMEHTKKIPLNIRTFGYLFYAWHLGNGSHARGSTPGPGKHTYRQTYMFGPVLRWTASRRCSSPCIWIKERCFQRCLVPWCFLVFLAFTPLLIALIITLRYVSHQQKCICESNKCVLICLSEILANYFLLQKSMILHDLWWIFNNGVSRSSKPGILIWQIGVEKGEQIGWGEMKKYEIIKFRRLAMKTGKYKSDWKQTCL